MLTGEVQDDLASLTDRARALILAIGKPVADDPTEGLTPSELAGCVTRTLALPEIVELRPTLVPEFPVYASTEMEGVEQATAGIIDATSFGPDGKPKVVIDHYRAQVRNYLDVTGTERGLIVLVTTGDIIAVTPATIAAVAA